MWTDILRVFIETSIGEIFVIVASWFLRMKGKPRKKTKRKQKN